MRTRTLAILLPAAALLGACEASRTPTEASSAGTTARADSTATGYRRELTQGEYRFDVGATRGAAPQLTLRARRGRTLLTDPLRTPLSGRITRAVAADLNGNAQPEVYVFTDAGTPNGGFYAYELTSAGFRPLPGPGRVSGRAGIGYQGRDSYAVSGRTLIRSFPLGGTIDTAGARTITYQLGPANQWKIRQVMEGGK